MQQENIINIWNRFNRNLASFICKKADHLNYCDDILQEVFIKIIENIEKIEAADNMKSYLIRMADNAVTDHYRKKTNKPADELPEDTLLLDESERTDLSLQLADCCLRPMIESLEPVYRDVLIKTELEGWTFRQYAESTGISYTNAKIRGHRARQKLKEIILNCCNYEFDKYGNIISCEKNSKSCCSN